MKNAPSLASHLFLALCEDRPDDPEGFNWTLYFVNAGDEPIEDLVIKSFGLASDIDQLIETSWASKPLGTVSAGASVEVEQNDLGEFDFMVTFIVSGKLKGKTVGGTITRRKYIIARDQTQWIPELGKNGVIIRGE